MLLHLLNVRGLPCVQAAQEFLPQVHKLLLFAGCRGLASPLLPLQHCRHHLLLPPLPAVGLSGKGGVSKDDVKLLLLGTAAGGSGGDGNTTPVGVFWRRCGTAAGCRRLPLLAVVGVQRPG